MKSDFKFGWLLCLLGIIYIVLYCTVFDQKMDMNGDNFAYLNFASALAEGHGYTSPYTPDFKATNFFPPGYPAILSVVMLLFGKNIVAFKVLNGLFFGGILLLFFLMVRWIADEKLSKGWRAALLAFFITLLLIVNRELLRFSTIIMSEIPYLFFSILAVWALVRYSQEEKTESGSEANPFRRIIFYLIIVSSSAAYYIRGIGLCLAAAIILYYLCGKRWKHAGGYTLGWLLLWLPWKIRDMHFGLKGRYFDTITVANVWHPDDGQINTVSGFISKFIQNFYDTVIKGFTEVAFPFIHLENCQSGFLWTFGIFILLLCFYGAWETGPRLRWFFITYIVANIGIFLLWHGGNGARYVRPLAPFIVFCLMWAVFCLIRFACTKREQSFGLLADILVWALCLTGVFCSSKNIETLFKVAKYPYPAAYSHYFDIAKMFKEQHLENTMVICRKPEIFHFFSGCYVAQYKWTADQEALIKDMVARKADFVVLDNLGYASTPQYLYPAVQANEDLFKIVTGFNNPATVLLHFDRKAAAERFGMEYTE